MASSSSSLSEILSTTSSILTTLQQMAQVGGPVLPTLMDAYLTQQALDNVDNNSGILGDASFAMTTPVPWPVAYNNYVYAGSGSTQSQLTTAAFVSKTSSLATAAAGATSLTTLRSTHIASLTQPTQTTANNLASILAARNTVAAAIPSTSSLSSKLDTLQSVEVGSGSLIVAPPQAGWNAFQLTRSVSSAADFATSMITIGLPRDTGGQLYTSYPTPYLYTNRAYAVVTNTGTLNMYTTNGGQKAFIVQFAVDPAWDPTGWDASSDTLILSTPYANIGSNFNRQLVYRYNIRTGQATQVAGAGVSGNLPSILYGTNIGSIPSSSAHVMLVDPVSKDRYYLCQIINNNTSGMRGIARFASILNVSNAPTSVPYQVAVDVSLPRYHTGGVHAIIGGDPTKSIPGVSTLNRCMIQIGGTNNTTAINSNSISTAPSQTELTATATLVSVVDLLTGTQTNLANLPIPIIGSTFVMDGRNTIIGVCNNSRCYYNSVDTYDTSDKVLVWKLVVNFNPSTNAIDGYTFQYRTDTLTYTSASQSDTTASTSNLSYVAAIIPVNKPTMTGGPFYIYWNKPSNLSSIRRSYLHSTYFSDSSNTSLLLANNTTSITLPTTAYTMPLRGVHSSRNPHWVSSLAAPPVLSTLTGGYPLLSNDNDNISSGGGFIVPCPPNVVGPWQQGMSPSTPVFQVKQ